MTLPTLLPDAIYVLPIYSLVKGHVNFTDLISEGIFYYLYLMVVYKALYIDL
jgi:hypothetical protein